MKVATTRRFAPTINQLAADLELSRSRVYELRAFPDFPAKTAKGWPIEAVSEFVEARAAEASDARATPELDALRARKLETEIALNNERLATAKAERAEVEGRTIPRDQWARDMTELATMCAAGFNEGLRTVEALCTDDAVVRGVAASFDSVRATIARDATARGWEQP